MNIIDIKTLKCFIILLLRILILRILYIIITANKLYRVYIIQFSNLKNDPTGHGWSSKHIKLK